jgi:hypothetical protein
MRVDSLERLINHAADPSVFRDIGLLYLKLLGYREVELTDGSGDLGSDVSVWQIGGNREQIAIQMSVQRQKWAQKAERDALLAKERLKLSNFTYLTSHRLRNEQKQKLEARLWSKHEINARFVDCRAIASLFRTEHRTRDALEALQIPLRESAYGERQQKPPVKEDLAYAYAFLGTDVTDFRKDVIERSVAAYITRESDSLPRGAVETAVASALGLSPARHNLVSSRIDHMLQRGDLTVADGVLTASAAIIEESRAVRILRSRQWRTLQDEISTALGNAGIRGAKLERLTTDISDAAGALLMNSADTAKASIAAGDNAAPIRKQIEVKLRQVEHKLTGAGIKPDDAAATVQELTVCISRSEIGQTLLAGYLFVSLLEMSGEKLLQALGGRGVLEVFLDASVAIPILASLLYEAHENSFFRTSLRAHEQAQRYGVDLRLPRDYLEEAASHLIDASELYQPLRESGEDLRFSQNAFVAHYATLTYDGAFERGWSQYAASFGLTEAVLREEEFPVKRDRVMGYMERCFATYGIKVIKFGKLTQPVLADAEKDVAFTARELKIQRPTRLLRHDTYTVAALNLRSQQDPSALIFCTWDRLHLELAAASPGPLGWQAADPSMLSDLLALASTEPDEAVGAAVEIAMGLNQTEAQLASEIWDELVRLEKSNLYDADLMDRAQQFKREYVTKSLKARTREPLAAAWARWKESEVNA